MSFNSIGYKLLSYLHTSFNPEQNKHTYIKIAFTRRLKAVCHIVFQIILHIVFLHKQSATNEISQCVFLVAHETQNKMSTLHCWPTVKPDAQQTRNLRITNRSRVTHAHNTSTSSRAIVTP